MANSVTQLPDAVISNPKNWVIANWKMQPMVQSHVTQLVTQLQAKLAVAKDQNHLPNIVLAPSFVHLGITATTLNPDTGDALPFVLAAQNLCGLSATQGAFTGEVSAEQLRDLGVTAVIIGHSERRQYFAETNTTLAQKIHCANAANLQVILCVGETAEQYDAGITQPVIREQLAVLTDVLADKDSNNKPLKNLLIAYEPVWAIGTGKVPTVAEVTQVHEFIQHTLKQIDLTLASTPLLYGGSVKADNAHEFAQSPAVSGVLVGGASLNADSFWQIIQAFA